MAYATPEEVRIRIEKNSVADDALLTALIEAVGTAINQHCNRHDGFEAGTASAREYAPPYPDMTYIYTDEFTSISLVETRGSAGGSYATLSAGLWQAFSGDSVAPSFNRTPYHGVLVRNAYFPQDDGFPTIRITATWGYSATVPAPIREATITQVARVYKRAQSAYADVVGDDRTGTMLYRRQLDPDVKFMLERYCRPSVG